MSITSIPVHIDIINGSYVEGSKKPVIYSLYPKVNPGYKIIQKPHNPIYIPIVRKNIRTLNVPITDQNNDFLDLRGEEEVIRFHLREKKYYKMSAHKLGSLENDKQTYDNNILRVLNKLDIQREIIEELNRNKINLITTTNKELLEEINESKDKQQKNYYDF